MEREAIRQGVPIIYIDPKYKYPFPEEGGKVYIIYTRIYHMSNLKKPSFTMPVDGIGYFFKKFNIEGDEVDILADALDEFEKSIVHVEIEVMDIGAIGVSVNGVPSSPASGKTITLSLPWSFRGGPITSMSAVRISGSSPVPIEVEYYTCEVE